MNYVNLRRSAVVANIQQLSKGSGPGSHGGNIIGYTKSGKPIYSSHYHPTHKTFSSQDHEDAAELNERKKQAYHKKYQTSGKSSDKNLSIDHGSNSYYHKIKADLLNRRK